MDCFRGNFTEQFMVDHADSPADIQEIGVFQSQRTDGVQDQLPGRLTFLRIHDLAILSDNDHRAEDAIALNRRQAGRIAEAEESVRAAADAVAAAILDWRDTDPLTQPAGGAEDPDYAAAGLTYGAKDAPFEDISELQQVLGVDRALFSRVAPYLTVASGQSRPDPAYAAAPVLVALGLDGEAIVALRLAWDPASGAPPPFLPGVGPLVGAGSGTYSVASRARLRDGRETLLRAVVRAGGTGLPGSTYTPLEWEEEASR